MRRIRTLAAAAATLAFAACADAPTAVQPGAMLSDGIPNCSPTLAGPTEVTGGAIETYKTNYDAHECGPVSSVSWNIVGGTSYLPNPGIKAFIVPSSTADCMYLHQTIHWVSGAPSNLYKVARIDGYTGTCPDIDPA